MPGIRPPSVVMKLDIEGSEIDVIPDLLLTGAFAHIDVSMIEFHHLWQKTTTDEQRKRRKQSISLQRALKTITAISPLLKNMFMDDEAYGVSEQKPLPRCKQDKNYSEREKNNNVPL